jgi:hypothetical protein
MGIAGRAELHPDAGHQRPVPVQQEVARTAGAGPGWLLVLVSVTGVPSELFVADVVEMAVYVADTAEGSRSAPRSAKCTTYRPLSGAEPDANSHNPPAT